MAWGRAGRTLIFRQLIQLAGLGNSSTAIFVYGLDPGPIRPDVWTIMVLHLKKLCVGVASVEELQSYVDQRLGRGEPLVHTTRQFPRRAEEILDNGGSLYWIINRKIAARQQILAFKQGQKSDGTAGWHIVLDAVLVPVQAKPHRAFQGWRYLEAKDAPPDSLSSDVLLDLPPAVAFEVAEFGVL